MMGYTGATGCQDSPVKFEPYGAADEKGVMAAVDIVQVLRCGTGRTG